MSEEKTISELSEIDGAFNKGNVYECAYAYHRWFAVGVYYECDGRGIFDNSGRVWANGGRSKFKLVTPKEEVKTMRTPFNLERAIAGDKVVNKRGCEYNQFSVIKTRIKDVIQLRLMMYIDTQKKTSILYYSWLQKWARGLLMFMVIIFA